MVDIEKSPDGRWWISEHGWGRPVGCLCKAMGEAKRAYPNKQYTVLDTRR